MRLRVYRWDHSLSVEKALSRRFDFTLLLGDNDSILRLSSRYRSEQFGINFTFCIRFLIQQKLHSWHHKRPINVFKFDNNSSFNRTFMAPCEMKTRHGRFFCDSRHFWLGIRLSFAVFEARKPSKLTFSLYFLLPFVDCFCFDFSLAFPQFPGNPRIHFASTLATDHANDKIRKKWPESIELYIFFQKYFSGCVSDFAEKLHNTG